MISCGNVDKVSLHGIQLNQALVLELQLVSKVFNNVLSNNFPLDNISIRMLSGKHHKCENEYGNEHENMKTGA